MGWKIGAACMQFLFYKTVWNQSWILDVLWDVIFSKIFSKEFFHGRASAFDDVLNLFCDEKNVGYITLWYIFGPLQKDSVDITNC